MFANGKALNKATVTGVDIVQVERFEKWRTFSKKSILRIFSAEEFAYAAANDHFFAQRLAVRFAAKEAFLKAVQQILPNYRFSLLQIANAISVSKHPNGTPFLNISYKQLPIPLTTQQFTTTVSLSHSQCCAIATVTVTFEHTLL
ncbi:4'-phosphopantetheinyl transferase superfamily protein [bacterium]|nr:MAG: 4'-phosphopantetheinyl transferase superfamily protein [bacterium]QQR62104.1 MAG: 4'-phosphopantetheinyl transferase superfamily protein [bacterium]QQR63339.1 MAG: 4'-phosphopantetheinyl transferase superfamily protein [bacterium]